MTLPPLKAGTAGPYLDALNTHNAAVRKFEQAKQAYRVRSIGDTEFLSAKATYDAATAVFDVAYAIAASIGGND